MPEKATLRRAQRDKRQGKSASTQAGEFVREEIDHIREGKHGARSAKQAIAIGLSKARRAGVKLKARAGTRDSAEEAKAGKKPAAKRSRATRAALKKEGTSAASHTSPPSGELRFRRASGTLTHPRYDILESQV